MAWRSLSIQFRTEMDGRLDVAIVKYFLGLDKLQSEMRERDSFNRKNDEKCYGIRFSRVERRKC